MKNKLSIFKFEVLSIIFTVILGALLHFTFNLSNNNILISIFSSVNESTWEHLKLLFFPMLITTIIGYFYYKKDIPNYLCIKTRGIILSLIFVVIFFYTYTGIIGKNYIILDISSFIIGIIIGEYYTYKKIISNLECNNSISIIIILIITLCFIIFTFYQPKINLFKDPQTGNFGILKENS